MSKFHAAVNENADCNLTKVIDCFFSTKDMYAFLFSFFSPGVFRPRAKYGINYIT